jgi:excinuclease ABC subunit A
VHGLSIDELLEKTVEEAIALFRDDTDVAAPLWVLERVGLGYLRLGQPALQLSGGESQRLKIARELSGRGGTALVLLDEPTVGLHYADVQRLLEVLDDLVARGDTVVVIEHNLDVIRNSDWIVDLGPDGGDRGGQLVVDGTPETVAACEASWTGRYLREAMERMPAAAAAPRRERQAPRIPRHRSGTRRA